MPEEAVEIIGEFEREIWSTPEHESPRYVIGGISMNGDKEVTTVKGYAEEGELRPGIPYRFYGNWKTHKTWGKQFEFKTFTPSAPHGRRGVIRYLMQLPGIGEVVATQMWDCWETEAIDKLRDEPELAADRIRFLTPVKAGLASETLKKSKMLENVTIELMDLLDGRGFPKKTIREAINRWGNRAPELISRNPYLTVVFRGVGFGIADKLYLDLGKDPARLKRQTMCLEYAILNDGGGHTWFSDNWCLKSLQEKIASADVLIGKAVKLGVRTKRLAFRRDAKGRPWIALREHADNESAIADKIKGVAGDGTLWAGLVADVHDVSSHQGEMLKRATQGKIGVLTGSPGTGKTHTTAAIVREVIARFGAGSVAVCAPTGKAAVRVTEAMHNFGVDVQARTIHSTLRAYPNESGPGWTFQHNSKEPLQQQFIFVDESSMIDASLMDSLLRATHRDAHVLFVGDVSQLPPVGHGAPLRDFVLAGLPHGELSEIRRNSGRIVKACAQIKATGRFDVSPRLNTKANENLVIVKAGSESAQKHQILDLVRGVHSSGRDPVWDLQVLCAVNDNSPVSRKKLNPWLQSFLNKDGARCDDNPFRVRDKVMCIKNGWYKLHDGDEVDKVFVANGELGRVHEVAPAHTVVDLEAPQRRVFVPRAVNGKSETGCDWVLGYVCTCHKYQGSEVPVVAVLIDETVGAKFVCDRAWVYTAISRAKHACVLIGQKSTAVEFCKRQTIRKRKTFLAERIISDQ
jgi:exodeoxyribonuclease V alpha subunit